MPLSHRLIVALVCTGVASAADPAVQPKEVHKVFDTGKHNAFTALAKFQGDYWLTFRSATDHNSGDGDLVVLRSKDGKAWSEAFRLNVLPDDRDPQFLATEKRLFLYDNAMRGPELTAFVTYTDDGKTWSKPEPVYEPRFIMWKPTTFNGRHYAAVHKKEETGGGKGRTVHLVTSADGVKWDKISVIRAGNWESETTLYFTPKGRAVALLRQKYGSPPAQVLEADAPYQEWKAKAPPVNHFSGHCVRSFRGVTYVLSRTHDYKANRSGTMVYVVEGDKLTPYCALPSGGDCAYPEAAELGDDMLVSWYSSHEGPTSIYTALVPLKK